MALRPKIKADKQPKIGAFDMARRTELLNFYRLFYVPFSNVVHTSVRDLQGDRPVGVRCVGVGPHG
jgi:hypothetical protein